MRRVILGRTVAWPLAAAFLGILVFVVAANIRGAGEKTTGERSLGGREIESAADRLIVHEWGTFTSFAGSDSVQLEFRPLVDNDLPPFVLDRGRQAGAPLVLWKRTPVRQRMETPVTYFYTDRARSVKVQVEFPQGLLTEFFPPVASMQPPFTLGETPSLSDSSLDWGQLWLIPEEQLRPALADAKLADRLRDRVAEALLPETSGDDHYAYARQTDSALVYAPRPGDPEKPAVPRGDYFEKFLFYRGVGNFELPLQLQALGDERYRLVNSGDQRISSLFLVTVDDNRLRFTRLDAIRAGQERTIRQTRFTGSVEQLSEAVIEALVGEGLYDKEARAMVNTWKASWFGEQGTRLFYTLPQRMTDELLPLHVEPQPEEVVRVMVGRLEIMNPEEETQIEEVLRERARHRASQTEGGVAVEQTEPENRSLPPALRNRGRLAEPALVRVKGLTKDAGVRREAELLLSELRK